MALEDTLKNTFKLSLYEVKVYTALLQKDMTPKEASGASGVPLPRVYDTMKSLEGKGFLTSTDGRYKAAPPEVALKGRLAQFRLDFERKMQERETETLEAVKKLEMVYHQATQPQEIVMLNGINSIASKFLEIIEESREVYISVHKALEAKDVLLAFLEKSGNRDVKIRMLLPEKLEVPVEQEDFIGEWGIEVRRQKSPLFDMIVADGRDVLIGVPDPLSDEVYHSVGIWIRNPSFAGAVQDSLETLWQGLG